MQRRDDVSFSPSPQQPPTSPPPTVEPGEGTAMYLHTFCCFFSRFSDHHPLTLTRPPKLYTVALIFSSFPFSCSVDFPPTVETCRRRRQWWGFWREIAIITIVIFMIITLRLVDVDHLGGGERERRLLKRVMDCIDTRFARGTFPKFSTCLGECEREPTKKNEDKLLWSSITEIMFYSYFYCFVNIDKKWLFRRKKEIFRFTR